MPGQFLSRLFYGWKKNKPAAPKVPPVLKNNVNMKFFIKLRSVSNGQALPALPTSLQSRDWHPYPGQNHS